MTERLARGAGLAAACLLALAALAGAVPEEPAAQEVVAWLDGRPITRADVGPPVAFAVWRHEVDIHSILKAATEELVDRRLLEAEAARRGVSSAELLASAEQAAGAEPVGEAEVDAYLAEHPRESAAAATAARPRIRHFLEERQRIQGRISLMEKLREQAGYRFVLAPPEQPRARIEVPGAPARGPADAPITIVHFASFSARESARSAQRIARLVEEFPGKLRHVHVSFVGDRDELGLLAAQVARAAQPRGAFWPLHDALFAHEGRLGADDVRAAGEAAGLSAAELERAAGDPALLEQVRAEIAAGVAAGVPRAPTLFVNGRYLSGLLPYDELREIVASELGVNPST